MPSGGYRPGAGRKPKPKRKSNRKQNGIGIYKGKFFSSQITVFIKGDTKILLHSRNQWNRINEKFNNSLFEISSRSTLNRNSRKMKVAWAYGLSFLSEDLMIFPEIGNSVFIKKKELLLFPFTLEMKITKNSYISASPLNVTFRKYDLESSLSKEFCSIDKLKSDFAYLDVSLVAFILF